MKVDNNKFLNLIKEYHAINEDDGSWLIDYKTRFTTRFKNNKITEEKYKSVLEFVERKTKDIENKCERRKLLSEEDLEKEQRKLETLKNELATKFYKIIEGRLSCPQFRGYSGGIKDSMNSDAIYYMLLYLDRYDTTKDNPFAYFTQIATNAFIMNINKYKKQEEIIQRLDYVENLGYEGNRLN